MLELKKLNFPKAMNLHLLTECLDEQKLKDLIVNNSHKSRLARRIVLPSNKCLKKIVFHFLVKKHKGDLDAVMIELRNGFKTFRELNISKGKIREMWRQREKEIERE